MTNAIKRVLSWAWRQATTPLTDAEHDYALEACLKDGKKR